MLAVPVATPVTIPVVLPMVATDVLPLLHVPPVVVFERVVLLPVHTSIVPVMDDGVGYTYTESFLAEVHPSKEALTLYTFRPVTTGVMVVVSHDVHERPVAPPMPVHVYDGVALPVTEILSNAQYHPHTVL